MGAFDILHHLRERGLTVETGEPGRLIVRPASKLDDDLREQIRAHKAELLDALVADRPPPADDLPRLTPDELRQVIGWSDDEIARAGRYTK